ncbi:MAG: hypothetical protein J3T61_00455 [Candidatus Brocadiales bacterium]|nr:hypothetical protein [Candidatus Bathyanammoxibius sp.]
MPPSKRTGGDIQAPNRAREIRPEVQGEESLREGRMSSIRGLLGTLGIESDFSRGRREEFRTAITGISDIDRRREFEDTRLRQRRDIVSRGRAGSSFEAETAARTNRLESDRAFKDKQAATALSEQLRITDEQQKIQRLQALEGGLGSSLSRRLDREKVTQAGDIEHQRRIAQQQKDRADIQKADADRSVQQQEQMMELIASLMDSLTSMFEIK